VVAYTGDGPERLDTRSGWFGQSQFWVIKTLSIG